MPLMDTTTEPETPAVAVPRPGGRRSLPWFDIVAVLVLGAAAGMLVFYKLTAKNLAADEATSFFIAQLDWGRLWQSLATSEANASAFYVSLHYWLTFGESEFVIRVLPAVFGLATVPVLYLVGARLFGRLAGIAAGALLAANAFFVEQAQDLRGYSMSAFFVTLASWLFLRAVEKPTWPRWAAYAAAGTLGLYSHFFAALVLLAHLVSLLFLKWKDVPLKHVLAGYVSIGVLGGPLAYFIAFNDVGQVDWIPRLTAERALNGLEELAGRGSPMLVASAVLVLATLGVGLYHLATKRRSFETFKFLFVVGWVLFPIAFCLGISLFKPLFVARYLLVALPGIALAGAAGLTLVRFKLLYAVAAIALVALAAIQLDDFYRASPGLDWEAKADLVIAEAQPGDVALFFAPTVIRPFGYYAGYYAEHETGLKAPGPIYPGINWLGYSATRFRPDLAAIESDVSQARRLWLITGYARDKPRQKEQARIEALLAESCGQVLGGWFRGTVRLYGDCG